MQTVVLENLSKTFSGGKKAVKDVSLSLEKGEVFGFLGPNGAGKTTTVKLLNGMLVPSEGRCSVMGYDPVRDPEKVHAVSGVLTEHARMYDNMTGLQNLIFYAQIFGISEEEGKKRAMIHRPEVLFLDEPTSGLDPESAQNVNRLIREMAGEQGTTVFLCTHQLRYAQEICTRYGLIEEGRLLAQGTLEELREEVNPGAEILIRGENLPESTERNLHVKIQSEKEIPGIIRNIVEAGGDIYEVKIVRSSLEDIYFTLTTKGGRRRFGKDESTDASHRVSDRGERRESLAYSGNYIYQ